MGGAGDGRMMPCLPVSHTHNLWYSGSWGEVQGSGFGVCRRLAGWCLRHLSRSFLWFSGPRSRLNCSRSEFRRPKPPNNCGHPSCLSLCFAKNQASKKKTCTYNLYIIYTHIHMHIGIQISVYIWQYIHIYIYM